MNRILLSFGFLALSMIGSSQSPITLLDENRVWSCYGDYFFLNVKYKLGSDTIINGKTWKKVFAHGSDVPFNFDSSQAIYKSALREENGKVWVVEKGFITEHILYDTNKNAGDTIRFYRPIGDFNQGVLPHYVIGKVYKTNQVMINGVAHKRLYIHDPYMVDLLPPQALSGLDSQADIWIEGIGAKTGLFSRMPEWGVIGSTPYLLACVESNGILEYANNTGYPASLDDPCFIIPEDPGGNTGGGGGGTGGNDSLILSNTQSSHEYPACVIYPNPVADVLQVRPIRSEHVISYIINASGRRVAYSRFESINGLLSMDVRGLTRGIYTLIIEGESISLRKRFVKE